MEPAGGRQDFNDTSIVFSIEPSNGEVEMQIPVIFVDDDINEAQEGLILRLVIIEIDPLDDITLLLSRRDTALLRITDNDG